MFEDGQEWRGVGSGAGWGRPALTAAERHAAPRREKTTRLVYQSEAAEV